MSSYPSFYSFLWCFSLSIFSAIVIVRAGATEDSSSWALHDDKPSLMNFSSPAPYIFSSLNGLLQQWPNTFFPNGHTISACEVPKHTLLYHGRHDEAEPPSPEWLAFDMEMSFAIMGNMPTSRLLTYRTTRAVKCLYFDGMSASLMGSGTESQMTFLYGDSDKIPSRPWPRPPGHGGPPGRGGPPHRPPHGEADDESEQHQSPLQLGVKPDDGPPRWNPLKDEYFRARGLCNWIQERGLGGLGWGYEGIVRMNAGFEMIWCDFNSTSLRLISNLDISAPLLNTTELPMQPRRHPSEQILMLSERPDLSVMDEGPHGPGMTNPREPFRALANYMWFTASAKRYGSNGNVDRGGGETRIKADTCGMFTFYDPKLSGQSIARTEQELNDFNISADGRWTGPKIPGDSRALALDELIRRRHSHRTNHVAETDGQIMYQLVENGLRRVINGTSCSGTSWDNLAKEITTFYASLIRDLQKSIRSLASGSNVDYETTRQELIQTRFLTHWFLLPFFEYPAGPYTPEYINKNFSIHSLAAEEGIERCSSQYTVDDPALLSENEKLLASAIDETLTSICSSTFWVGLEVERRWLLSFNNDAETTILTTDAVDNITETAKAWLNELEELMAWLAWVDQWTGCEGGCAIDEICYIPMWPVSGFGFGRDIEKFLWEPICVNSSLSAAMNTKTTMTS